jgi:hypothetical protein
MKDSLIEIEISILTEICFNIHSNPLVFLIEEKKERKKKKKKQLTEFYS